MQICLPTGSQRNTKFVRNKCTEHPQIARTSDLDYIGIKVPHQGGHFSIVSPEYKVIFVGAVERKVRRLRGSCTLFTVPLVTTSLRAPA